VLGQLYARMAPETADRVESTGLHRWAIDLLRDRGHDVRLNNRDSAQAYRIAWAQVGKPGPLAKLDMPWDYWREEIDHVIKGRGLTSFEQYADLVRVGRRTRLGPEQRRAVWDLYCEYERRLDDLGAHDFNDVLLLALAEVRRRRPEPGYVAVVVDEVQDLNRVGVQLLHALVGDGPDGLLLIGDGQQAVYPGGFTLIEAGVAISGRAAVLRVNYRNTEEILQYATELVSRDRFDDLERPEEIGARECEVVRRGPRPIRVDAADVASHDAALVQIIRDTAQLLGVSLGDLAVLAAHRRTVRTYAGVLRAAGIPTVDLQDYDGLNRPGFGGGS
jgi:superfamily I DNA/RNA helicase